MNEGGVAVWGFLVGFVGWVSCLRLAEPIAAWLMVKPRAGSVSVVLVRFFVTIFLIFATFLAIAVLPMFIVTFSDRAPSEGLVAYKRLFGIGFAASMVGLFILSLLSRSRSSWRE
jgi:hypothetical protein